MVAELGLAPRQVERERTGAQDVAVLSVLRVAQVDANSRKR